MCLKRLIYDGTGGQAGGPCTAALGPVERPVGSSQAANAALAGISPLNREMALNYVAQHSLGLPKSY